MIQRGLNRDMEGPIDFDIWCIVDKQYKEDVISWVEDLHGISKLEATKIVLPALRNNDYLQIFTEVGWDDVSKLKNDLPTFVDSYRITESTYKPGDYLSMCDEHQLLYAREGGCPVCNGFYVKTNKDGVKIV